MVKREELYRRDVNDSQINPTTTDVKVLIFDGYLLDKARLV